MATKKVATKSKEEEPESKEEPKAEWDPEKVRRFRMTYDDKVRDGASPKDISDAFTFEGGEYVMGFAYYLLEYLETCIFWPPQSRVYNVQPKLDE
jgi:hypothetical protein